MALTRKEVEKMAHLARLELTAVELIHYQEQLSAILDYADILNELDLTGVVPTAHAITRQNVYRPDIIEPSLPLADVLHNAPQHSQNQFLIQSVLEE